jgi:flagellar motility protein MotE (MotC chaperone)
MNRPSKKTETPPAKGRLTIKRKAELIKRISKMSDAQAASVLERLRSTSLSANS